VEEGGVQGVLIDTYSVFFRAYYALPPMQTSQGESTSALYGFSVLLLKILREHRPVELAFALDAPQKTFRHERYEGYKAQRDSVPYALAGQLDRLRQLITALAVPTFCVPGFEADDILATLAHELRARGQPVLAVSGDRDLLQLAQDGSRLLFLGARGKAPVIYDARAVEQRYQVRPDQLPSWVALAGDPSDNLPPVPGIGSRTASRLIAEFGTISNLLARLDAVTPARIRETLRAHAEQARLTEDLARLRTDVPLGEGARAATLDRAAFGRLRQLFAELEFKSLVNRVDVLERDAD
jgi:DNA polymerase-1